MREEDIFYFQGAYYDRWMLERVPDEVVEGIIPPRRGGGRSTLGACSLVSPGGGAAPAAGPKEGGVA